MSTFSVSVVRIKAIEPITGADAIELAVVGDYRSVVMKGVFKPGDLGIYIPEAAIVPTWLLRRIGLEGKLAGPSKNRVKAIKLRGCLSQGVLMEVGRCLDELERVHHFVLTPREESCGDNLTLGDSMNDVVEGDDLAALLGITKWEPPIPTSLSGEVYAAGQHLTVAYDIENVKRFPDVLEDGELVVYTEKIHGTFCGVGLVPVSHKDPKHYKGEFVVFSKGLGSQGLCFKETDKNEQNVYFRALNKCGIFDKLREIRDACDNSIADRPLFILGEVYGAGIQDAGWYSDDVAFRMFDMGSGFRGDQHYFDYVVKLMLSKAFGIDMVPTLYRGPHSKEEMLKWTSGKESVSGTERNMREGVVVTPMVERYQPDLGRVILKSVSEQYLLRKGGTEFN